MSKWLVLHIGCIECGCPSGIVGLFANYDQADRIANDCNDKHSWLNGGQNSFEVVELPEEGIIHNDYEGISL